MDDSVVIEGREEKHIGQSGQQSTDTALYLWVGVNRKKELHAIPIAARYVPYCKANLRKRRTEILASMGGDEDKPTLRRFIKKRSEGRRIRFDHLM
jgi:hypothetical protein